MIIKSAEAVMHGGWLAAWVVALSAGRVSAAEAPAAAATEASPDEGGAPDKQQVHDERLYASPFFEGPAQLYQKRDAEIDLYADGTFLKEDWHLTTTSAAKRPAPKPARSAPTTA